MEKEKPATFPLLTVSSEVGKAVCFPRAPEPLNP